MPAAPRQYDAFISFKHSGRGGSLTPDADAARAVYDALMGAGVRTFFSPECLKHQEKGKFARSIETALESAKFLVLVASCREHIDSSWVETEWDTFINDDLSPLNEATPGERILGARNQGRARDATREAGAGGARYPEATRSRS